MTTAVEEQIPATTNGPTLGAVGSTSTTGEERPIDDALKPAAEAFALAQEQIDQAEPVQRSLPGVIPPFNFEGAYLELEAKAIEVDRLHTEYTAIAEEARDAKKAWDKAAELYTKMALELRRRRQSKVPSDDAGSPQSAPRLVTCAWVEKHPGESCLLCDAVPAVIERLMGNPSALAATDAQAHVEDADRFAVELHTEVVQEALADISIHVDASVIREWTPADRDAVERWAEYQDNLANGIAQTDPDAAETPSRPAVLGRPHVPQKAIVGERQCCAICDVVLVPAPLEDEKYAETDQVGTDCSGRPAEEPRYPTRGSKKATRRKKG